VDASSGETVGAAAACRVVDVSYGGMKVETGALGPDEMRRLEQDRYALVVTVTSPKGDRVRVRGRAAWARLGESGRRVSLGVRFRAVDDRQVATLVDWARGGAEPSKLRPWAIGLGIAVAVLAPTGLWRMEASRASGAEEQVERLKKEASRAREQAGRTAQDSESARSAAATELGECRRRLEQATRALAAAQSAAAPAAPAVDSADPAAPTADAGANPPPSP
jgi:hypothetical protein